MTISLNVRRAHERAAEDLTSSYLCDLGRAEPTGPFGRLEARAGNWRHSLASVVYDTAACYRVHNIKYRHDLVVSTARWLIKQQLKANPALRAKLYAIRQHQEQADKLAAMAEQASWPALPIG